MNRYANARWMRTSQATTRPDAAASNQADAAHSATGLEKVFAALALFFISGAFLQNGLVYFPMTLVKAFALAVGLWAMRDHLGYFIRVSLSDAPILLTLAMVFASAFWSIDPTLTIDYAPRLLLATLFGAYLAARFTVRQQLDILLWMLGLSLVTSLVFTALFPGTGIMQSPSLQGRWRGVFNHKNQFGRIVALFGILALFMGAPLRWLRWPLFALSLPTLALTGSAAAVIAFVLHLVLVPLYRLARAHHLLITGTLLILAPLVALGTLAVAANTEPLLTLLGKDPTLTGRIVLWEASEEMIARRPIEGYGFRASFTADSEIFDLIDWKQAPSAHNHWLDTALDLGVPITLIFGLGYLRSVIRAIRLIRRSDEPSSLFPLTLLSFLLVVLMATHSLLGMLDVLWVMYVAVTLSLAQLETRWRQQENLLATRRKLPAYG